MYCLLLCTHQCRSSYDKSILAIHAYDIHLCPLVMIHPFVLWFMLWLSIKVFQLSFGSHTQNFNSDNQKKKIVIHLRILFFLTFFFRNFLFLSHHHYKPCPQEEKRCYWRLSFWVIVGKGKKTKRRRKIKSTWQGRKKLHNGVELSDGFLFSFSFFYETITIE